jgi:hypothetical protein
MRLISSRSTFVQKRVFPAIWFGFLALFVVVGFTKGDVPGALVLVPLTAGVVAFLVMRKLVFDLVDEVWDAGADLLVKNGGHEVRVPLAELVNVSYCPLLSPQRVTLTLRQPTALGREIAFVPPRRFIPFARSPIVDDLIQRVDAARTAAARAR